jgi:hypothetical protein
MSENRAYTIHDLANQVFGPPEKWGWEYREPVAARRSPEWDREPLWVEPTNRSAGQVRPRVKPLRVVVVVVILLIGLVLREIGIVLDVLAIVLAAIWFLPLLTSTQRARSQEQTAIDQRERDHAKYKDDWQAWRASMESWNAGERARIDKADLWYPVTPEPSVSRIDVFGGTSDGWAALVTTLGGSLLASDRFVLLLDLSEHDVSSDLVTMTKSRGMPIDVLDLPSGQGYAQMLAGLGSEDVAEILAEAVNTSRESGSVELRTLDAALIQSVTDRLEGGITFGKIGAGLQVLRRTYDPIGTDSALLSDSELLSLSAYVDAAGQDDQTQRELQFLINSIDLLVGSEALAWAQGSPEGFWRRGALVIRTSHQNARRKELADRVLVQILLRHLREAGGRSAEGAATLIIVGCDQLGLKSLESLSQMARRAGTKTVLVMEHLRGDLVQLLGGSDSASIIMRLGNAQEAAAAAEHIGRGHKFVMNQISRQLSDASTEGESKTWGATGTVTQSSSLGGGKSSGDSGGSGHRNWMSSTSVSRSDSWSRTVSWSTTNTVTDGATVSRVYEFAVEPTQIQSMPMTAFVFVGSSSGQRHVVAADCNPGISLLDRVARITTGPRASVPAADPAARGARILEQPGLPRSQSSPGQRA